MIKPIKKEDFIRHKDVIESPGANIHGTNLIHGHDIGFNEDISDYYSSINCGVFLDNSFDSEVSLLAPLENVDGFYIGQWEMVCPPNLKMGQIMDRMPFGIIDKTITGFGATTLELISNIRNSIVVVPTKALAYNKHIQINEKHTDLTMYVGSRYGNIASDTTKEKVSKYIHCRGNLIRKFITVADSLPKLLAFLEELGEPVYENYFLMIDEIDTMQMDSSYRPKLESVIDYYFKFDFMNRCMVSASIQSFSNLDIEREGRVLFRWEKQPQRTISLVNTNYVEDAAFSIIGNILEDTDDKILVAYNSLDGIFSIVKTLGLKPNEYGILCSNRNTDKVEAFEDNASDAITPAGNLKKRVTFITCAYFAGIDIIDSCHLVSISSFGQPFTSLSLAKLTQIAGRCRNGNLSETIIYDIAYNQTICGFENATDYRNSLLSRATQYATFLNQMLSIAKSDASLYPMCEFVKSYVSFAAKGKSSSKSYPLSIVREHSITKQFVPSYFNIDSLTDRWITIHDIYSEQDSLYNALVKQGHNVTVEPPVYIPKHEHNNEIEKAIKEHAKEQVLNQFEEITKELLAWEASGKNEYALEEIRRNANKRIQDNVIRPFELLHSYIQSEALLDGLRECFMHDRKVRNYINAAIFYALPNEHPFKASLLLSFNVDLATGCSTKRFTLNERHKRLKDVFSTVFKYEFNYDSTVLSDFLTSFFCWARNAQGNRISGLNPMEFPPLKKSMNVKTQLLNILVFPR